MRATVSTSEVADLGAQRGEVVAVERRADRPGEPTRSRTRSRASGYDWYAGCAVAGLVLSGAHRVKPQRTRRGGSSGRHRRPAGPSPAASPIAARRATSRASDAGSQDTYLLGTGGAGRARPPSLAAPRRHAADRARPGPVGRSRPASAAAVTRPAEPRPRQVGAGYRRRRRRPADRLRSRRRARSGRRHGPAAAVNSPAPA